MLTPLFRMLRWFALAGLVMFSMSQVSSRMDARREVHNRLPDHDPAVTPYVYNTPIQGLDGMSAGDTGTIASALPSGEISTSAPVQIGGGIGSSAGEFGALDPSQGQPVARNYNSENPYRTVPVIKGAQQQTERTFALNQDETPERAAATSSSDSSSALELLTWASVFALVMAFLAAAVGLMLVVAGKLNWITDEMLQERAEVDEGFARAQAREIYEHELHRHVIEELATYAPPSVRAS